MTKFKIGDEVYYNLLLSDRKVFGIVTKINNDPKPNSVWAKWDSSLVEAYMPEDKIFFVTPPKSTGFEVGKKYTLISTGHRVEVLHSNEKEHWLKNELGKTFIVHDRDFLYYEEYIPPPPEEWRIVYKDRYGNVTIGKTPFKSESEAKASRYWTDHKSSAFKIIRVDA